VPHNLTLVSVGKLVRQSREGGFAVTEWKSDIPMAVAGFNYGEFKRKQVTDEPTHYDIEAYATTDVPDFLRGAKELMSLTPSAMADSALATAQNSIRLFTIWFGAAPYGRIAITQQPQFNFGQSWPTLVYLPVTAFLDDTQRWALMGRHAFNFAHFIQEVTPHEIAHQWWGHMVGWSSYHDQWLSEGFADFSAGLYLQATEKKPDKYRQYWERSRKAILEKNEYGRSANDAGPLWMGLRLNTERNGRAYNRLVYPKGGYVLHMLRSLMWESKTGDSDFIAMMHDFVQTNLHKTASSETFRAMVQKHMKPIMDVEGNGDIGWFFREWVLGTDIPKYGLEYSLKQDGDAWLLSGKLTQSEVPESFVMRVPVYLEFDNGMMRLGSVRIQGSHTVDAMKALRLPKKPKRVLINVNYDVLASESSSKEVSY
jgi:aminopeptidase N